MIDYYGDKTKNMTFILAKSFPHLPDVKMREWKGKIWSKHYIGTGTGTPLNPA